MTPAVQKICCGCGQDVAGKKRTKDQQGNYYCDPCWVAFSSAKPHAHTHHHNEATGGTSAGHALAGDIAASPDQESVELAEMMSCPDCGGMFEISEMDMSGVCKKCAGVVPAAPPMILPHNGRSRKGSNTASRPPMAKETKLLVAGIGAPVVIAILFLVWFFVLRDTWEADHRYQILRLGGETLSQLRAKNDDAGLAKHDELLRLVGDHKLREPEVIKIVADVRNMAEATKQRIEEERRVAEAKRREEQRLAELRQKEAFIKQKLLAYYTGDLQKVVTQLGVVQQACNPSNYENGLQFLKGFGDAYKGLLEAEQSRLKAMPFFADEEKAFLGARWTSVSEADTTLATRIKCAINCHDYARNLLMGLIERKFAGKEAEIREMVSQVSKLAAKHQLAAEMHHRYLLNLLQQGILDNWPERLSKEGLEGTAASIAQSTTDALQGFEGTRVEIAAKVEAARQEAAKAEAERLANERERAARIESARQAAARAEASRLVREREYTPPPTPSRPEAPRTVSCPRCGGKGQIHSFSRGGGRFVPDYDRWDPCPTCRGSGQVSR